MDKNVLDEIEIKQMISGEIFPGILDRMKALIADSIVIVVLMISIGTVFSNFKNVPDQARMIAFIFVFVLYDPIFTSLFGGTIGHLIMKIKVRVNNDKDQKLMFPLALLRYLIKMLLGIVSFVTIGGNTKGQAILDLAANSVVVYRSK